MYFSSTPKGNWPLAMDARPPTQPEGSAIGVLSDSRGIDVGQTESSPPVSEKAWGIGQRQTSQPRRGGKRWVLLPSNWAASHLVMIRPVEHRGPLCSTGRMTMKFRRILHRARKSLHAALPWGINLGEAKKSLSHRRGKSPSSGQGKFPHSRQ